MSIEVLIFLLGAIIGSFLNVCIVRMPQEKSIVKPRSHCVHCKKMIPWYDNIPFISYLILGRKCRFCKEKISPRFFIVELLTAITFLAFYRYFGLNIILAPYLVMVSCFIVAIFVDFEHRIIPDEVSVGGMLMGLIFSLFIPQMHAQAISGCPFPHIHALGAALLGVLIGGGCIYAMGLLGDFLFKKESMGGGDVKLLAMIGAFMGWQLAVLTFFIAPVFGALFGIIEKIRTKESTIAYGPFLVLGALISLFKGKAIIHWLMSGYGLF